MLAADRAVSCGEFDADSLPPTSASPAIKRHAPCSVRIIRKTPNVLAVKLAERLTSAAAAIADPDLAGWSAMAHRGLIAARRTERFDALHVSTRLTNLAEQLGADANHGWTAFGPTNVAIHRVSVCAELGDPGEAIRLAADVIRHACQLD